MPTADEKLKERLLKDSLPTSLPIQRVIRLMDGMGYQLDIKGSHHHFRKPGNRRLTFAVHKKRIPTAAVAELAALIRAQGG